MYSLLSPLRSQEGGVTPTRIHRNPDGGEAYVEFVNGNDAQKAMGRNRAHIGRESEF